VSELCATDAEVVALDAHTLTEIEERAQLAYLIHPDLVDDPGLPHVELATPPPPGPVILDDIAR